VGVIIICNVTENCDQALLFDRSLTLCLFFAAISYGVGTAFDVNIG